MEHNKQGQQAGKKEGRQTAGVAAGGKGVKVGTQAALALQFSHAMLPTMRVAV